MARKRHSGFIAVVDDDDGVRTATLDLLASQGFRARGFSTAEQFLRSRQAARVECLILDIRLPGMTGVELQQHLHSSGSSTPVIYFTAEADVDAKLRGELLQAGALAVLSKPFDAEQLLSLVCAALGRTRAP